MTQHLKSVEHILQNITEEITVHKNNGKNVIVVFDLDSTIIEVTPRMTQILRDFTQDKHHRIRYMRECVKLERYSHHPKDWGIEHSLERLGLAGTSFDFYKDLMNFWKKRFFSNAYLHLDEPVPGSKEFLTELVSKGADVAYLTARENSCMLEGTIESLKKLEFPLHPKLKNLILKDDNSKSDCEFKRDVLKKYLRDYASVWFVENEPVNLNLVYQTLPQVKLVYFDSVHSGREEPPKEAAKISSFVFKK